MCALGKKNIFKKGKALIQSLATTQPDYDFEFDYRSFGFLFSEILSTNSCQTSKRFKEQVAKFFSPMNEWKKEMHNQWESHNVLIHTLPMAC